MVVSSLMGGLGNNLFQIAASIGTADFHGKDWKVQSSFEHQKYFSIPQERFIDAYALPRYTEPRFDYWQIPSGDWELYGYFQSEKYFKHCEKEIRKMFAAPHKVAEKIKWTYQTVLNKNTCAIHIRRGDYLKLSEYHYNLEIDYYLNAMKALPEMHFVCFSDDIEWCAKHIPAHDFIKDDDLMEFHLMSYCKNFIIANSTFSWWASWLSTNKDKIIIAPPKDKWFGQKNKSKNVTDLYCNNWHYQRPELGEVIKKALNKVV